MARRIETYFTVCVIENATDVRIGSKYVDFKVEGQPQRVRLKYIIWVNSVKNFSRICYVKKVLSAECAVVKQLPCQVEGFAMFSMVNGQTLLVNRTFNKLKEV